VAQVFEQCPALLPYPFLSCIRSFCALKVRHSAQSANQGDHQARTPHCAPHRLQRQVADSTIAYTSFK
jgi:hypothetical protein